MSSSYRSQISILLNNFSESDRKDVIEFKVDNGSESSGVRTQFLKRMVEFCDQIGKPIQLLYYPPYHSKYNPRHHWVSACDARFASAIAPIFGHHQHLQAASHHHRTLRERGVGDASIVTTRLVTRSLLKLRPYSAALQRLGGGLVAATAIAILLGWDVQVQLWLAPLFPAAPL